MSNKDYAQEILLEDPLYLAHELTAYQAYAELDTTESLEEYATEEDEDGELVRVEMFSLEDDRDMQEYAQELRRCCGDDVAAEELSCLTVELFVL